MQFNINDGVTMEIKILSGGAEFSVDIKMSYEVPQMIQLVLVKLIMILAIK